MPSIDGNLSSLIYSSLTSKVLPSMDKDFIALCFLLGPKVLPSMDDLLDFAFYGLGFECIVFVFDL